MADYKNPLQSWLGKLPTGTEISRRAWVEVKYIPADTGTEWDISEDLAKYLLSLSYTDNLADEADDLNIPLEDRAGL